MLDIEPMKSSLKNPILDVFQGTLGSCPPCWLMRQAGRHLPEYRAVRSKQKSFVDFLFNIDDVVEVTLQPLKRYDLDAAIIFSDILVVPMMLGIKVEVLEGKGPRLEQLRDPVKVSSLKDSYQPNLCNPVYEALSKVKTKLDPSKALIGFAGGPWTIASYMVEGQTSKSFIESKIFGYKSSVEFQSLLDILSDVTADHLINQIEAGADVVKIFDSWAGSVPYNRFNEWIINPHKRLVNKIRNKHPKIPIISFPKGIQPENLSTYINHVKVDCIAFGPEYSPKWISQNIQKKVVVQGGLDPAILVSGGKPMKEEVEKYIEALSQGRYLFNLGHGIDPQTPPEHVESLISMVREFKI